MQEPPMMLDGARVLEYAPFVDEARPRGRASTVVNGVAVDLDNIAGVVMTADLVHDRVYLLHCNKDWQTVAAETYADAESARAAANAAYEGISGGWRRFRPLTAEEEAEVSSTTRFLRELAEDFPDDQGPG